MTKYACVICVVIALVGVASAQTTNPGYEVATFGAPPGGGDWSGDTISVAADGKGAILALRRADPPVLVFNREGELQDSWGDGLFPNNHSIDVDHEGNVWITDRTDKMVHKFTMDGQKLMTLGTIFGSKSAVLEGTRLTITGSFEGLREPATEANLHRGLATGVRGTAFYELTVSPARSGKVSGSIDLNPDQIDSLRDGRLYVQIHSKIAPEGNLWGWLLH